MTAEDSELREYRQGDIVRLTVTVQDPSGVHLVSAQAYREGTGPGATPPATQEEQIYLSPDPLADPLPQPGSAPVAVVIQGMARTQVPGVYVCEHITAVDTLGNSKSTDLDTPRRFRIVESPQQDREGPEVVDVGEFS